MDNLLSSSSEYQGPTAAGSTAKAAAGPPQNTGDSDYLLNYLGSTLLDAIEKSLSQGDVERIRYRQREVHHEILRFTEAKARDFYEFCEQLINEHNARAAAKQQKEEKLADTCDEDEAPSVAKTKSTALLPSSSSWSSSSQSSLRSATPGSSPKVPLKSSFKQKPTSSSLTTVNSDSSSSNRTSPKRVMFASKPEVYVPKESDSSSSDADEEDFEGSDTDDDDDDNKNGEVTGDIMKNDGFDESAVSSHSSTLPGTTDNSARDLDYQESQREVEDNIHEALPNDEHTNMASETEDELFEFDESLGVEISPSEDDKPFLASNNYNESSFIQVPQAPETSPEAASSETPYELVNPSLGSSLPQVGALTSSLPRLIGSFKPNSQTKYLAVTEETSDDAGSDPPSRNGSIPLAMNTGGGPMKATAISPFASSLPVQISQSTPWSLSAREANDSNRSSVSGATPLDEREENQKPQEDDNTEYNHAADEDVELASLLQNGEASDNPFTNFSLRAQKNEDPSQMSFSERFMLEEAKKHPWEDDNNAL